MARITIPEFKSGELLDVDTFNQMNEEFRSLEIDDENLAIEGIHQRSIKKNTVFDDIVSDDFNKSKLLEATYDADDLPSGIPDSMGGLTPDTSGVGNPIKFASILSTEQVLIRVSCRVRMDDFGARTFATGKPPWVALMLRSFDPLEGEDDPPTEFRSDWDDIPETLQHFALAFTGRLGGLHGFSPYHRYNMIPILPSNGEMYKGPLIGYEPSALYNEWGRSTVYDYDPTVYGQFNYEFSYTFAYLYSPSTDQINKSFQVFGFQQKFNNDPHIELDNRQFQVGFWVEDFQLTAHKIKR